MPLLKGTYTGEEEKRLRKKRCRVSAVPRLGEGKDGSRKKKGEEEKGSSVGSRSQKER